MEQLNEIKVGNFFLAGEYYDRDADRIIERLKPCVLNEIKKIPLYPQLQAIEGGRK
jgi:hypothetical protein